MSGSDEFLLYTAPNGAVRVTVVVFNESVWLPQRSLAELFGVKVPAISKHLKNIFDSGELAESVVVSVLETTASDGKVYATRHFNLDAIIAVGYRVNSFQATQFRSRSSIDDGRPWSEQRVCGPCLPRPTIRRFRMVGTGVRLAPAATLRKLRMVGTEAERRGRPTLSGAGR